MKNILQQISKIADKENITIGALERKIGASKGVLSRAIANNTDIQAKWIQRIVENYPQINAEWLLTGEGSMYKSAIDLSIKPVDNEWLLRRIEELAGEVALLKKENDELKLSRGNPINDTTYPINKKIGSHIAAEPGAHKHT